MHINGDTGITAYGVKTGLKPLERRETEGTDPQGERTRAYNEQVAYELSKVGSKELGPGVIYRSGHQISLRDLGIHNPTLSTDEILDKVDKLETADLISITTKNSQAPNYQKALTAARKLGLNVLDYSTVTLENPNPTLRYAVREQSTAAH